MRNRLIKILQDMSRVAFTNEEKADYLREAGVIVPPVKVGQTVYSYCDVLHRVLPYFVESLGIAYLDEKTNCYEYIANCVEENDLLDSIDFEFEDIGQTVFLTEEEAEQKIIDGFLKN